MNERLTTVCIDFDNTIIPWSPVWKPTKPFPGVRDAMKELQKQGFRIYILTSRLSKRWCEQSAEYYSMSTEEIMDRQYRLVEHHLDLWGIPYDEMGAEKIPAIAYMDDLAVAITEEYPLPAAIYDFIEAKRGEGDGKGLDNN